MLAKCMIKSLLLLSLIALLLALPAYAGSSYGYWYREVLVDGGVSGLRNAVLNISVDTTSVKFAADCSDIVFTDESNNVLPFTIVRGCKTANTVVYVWLGNVPANTTKRVYMWYGIARQNKGVTLAQLLNNAEKLTANNVQPGDALAPHLYDWYFDGVDDYILVPSLPTPNIHTVFMSIKTTYCGSGPPYWVWAYIHVLSGTWWGATSLTVEPGHCPNPRAYYRISDANKNAVHVEAHIYDPSRFVEVATQFNGSMLKLYADGVLTISRSYSTTIPSETNNLHIGRPQPIPGIQLYISYFLYFYSAVDIAQQTSRVINPSSLRVFLDPTFFNGTRYIDLSGNNNHGVPYGGVSRVEAQQKWLWVVRGLYTDESIHIRFFRGYASVNGEVVWVGNDDMVLDKVDALNNNIVLYLTTFTAGVLGAENVADNPFISAGIQTAFFHVPAGDHVLYDHGGFIRLRTGSSDACFILFDNNISYTKMIVYSPSNYRVLYDGAPTTYCATTNITVWLGKVSMDPLRVALAGRNESVNPASLTTAFTEFIKSLGFIGWAIFMAFPATVWLRTKEPGLTLAAAVAAFNIAVLVTMPEALLQSIALAAGLLVGYGIYKVVWGD